MPLRLNLYHEVLKVKALKRRDPLKISIYALSAIAACCTAWYAYQLVVMHAINDDYLAKKAEFDKFEPQAKAAKKKEDELNTQAGASTQLVKRIEGRFYWAPLMAQLAQIVPRQVQITRLGADITGDGLRRCSISIDGLAAGTEPRKVAEEMRTAIVENLSPHYKNVTSTFKTLEDGTEMVMLDGKQVATATFAIVVQLYTGEEKTTPAPRKKR